MDAPARMTFKERATHPMTLAAVAAGLVVGGLAAAGGWWIALKPARETAERRYSTMQEISTLYGLQLQYKQLKGVYAGDLDALLSLMPDRDAFKARLAAHVDMNTLAVVGDAEKFKIEANVLDKERTLVRLKGPVHTQRRTAAPATPLPVAADEDGRPITPPAR